MSRDLKAWLGLAAAALLILAFCAVGVQVISQWSNNSPSVLSVQMGSGQWVAAVTDMPNCLPNAPCPLMPIAYPTFFLWQTVETKTQTGYDVRINKVLEVPLW